MSVNNWQIIQAHFVEDSPATLMAWVGSRPTTPNSRGTAYTQALFTSIVYSAFDESSATPTTAIAGHNAASLTVSAVIYDTLQGWDVDTTGHNFRTVIGATAFPVGGHQARIEIICTLTDGTVFPIVFQGPISRLSSS